MTEKVRTIRGALAFIPIILFLLLAGVFASQLLSGKDNSTLQSALLGKPAPLTNLPALQGLSAHQGISARGINSSDFLGQVTLINVFASWCVPCREEHPILLELAKDKRISLVGFNYKDKQENASQFLETLGNPYVSIGTDITGRAGIDWGVYGVPETYLIDRKGIIVYKTVGPLNVKIVTEEILPLIEKVSRR